MNFFYWTSISIHVPQTVHHQYVLYQSATTPSVENTSHVVRRDDKERKYWPCQHKRPKCKAWGPSRDLDALDKDRWRNCVKSTDGAPGFLPSTQHRMTYPRRGSHEKGTGRICDTCLRFHCCMRSARYHLSRGKLSLGKLGNFLPGSGSQCKFFLP
jgi:hypothetical protein